MIKHEKKNLIFILVFFVLIGISISNINAPRVGETSKIDEYIASNPTITIESPTTTDGRITGYYTNLPGLTIYTPSSSNSGSSSSYSDSICSESSPSSSSSSKKDLPDLTISKVTKKGNTHTVFIKNTGKKVAGKSVLGVYEGNKLIKKVNVKAIAKGKTVQVNVPLNAKFKNKVKTFKADYNNKIKESNKKNNDLRAK